MLLIQPFARQYNEMLEFANENGLGFELMDFSFPTILDDSDTCNKLLKKFKTAPVWSLHGVFIDINYSGGDPEIFKVSKKRIEQCAYFAKKLNAGRIVLHSCFFPILPPNDPLYDLWAEDSAQCLIEIAEKYDVEFYIENVIDLTPNVILKMIKAANHKKIGVCLDVGHANLTKTPLDVWINELAPHIRHIHLSDNNGMYDDHIALGDGNINWQNVNSLLEKNKVKANYTIEVKPFDNVKKSLEYLEGGAMPYVYKSK